jgi:hypothetical protein
VRPSIAFVEASMWKTNGRAAYWTELDCAALGLSFCIWTLPGEIRMISPPWVVSVGVQIITWSRESSINRLMRNISIISSSRTIIYLMHSTRTE